MSNVGGEIGGGKDNTKSSPADGNVFTETSSQETVNEVTREAIAQGSVDECKKLADDLQKAVCEMNVVTQEAKEKGDISVCSKISEVGFRENCEDQYYTYKAITSQNADVCAKVKNEIRKSQCEKYVAPQ